MTTRTYPAATAAAIAAEEAARIAGDALKLARASNLSDLASAATARTNLGLGTLATQSGTFSGTSSGTNTGDQTSVTGNAGTATALQTARTINGVSFNGTANINISIPYAHGLPIGDRLATSVLAAGHPWLLLRYAYRSSPCIKLRRASDDATSDFGFVGGVLDWEAVQAWRTTSRVYFDTIYDQFSLGAHWTQATTANQPEMVFNDGNAQMFFDGTNDYMSQATGLGLTGSPALSVAWIVREVARGWHWALGDSAISEGKYIGALNHASDTILGIRSTTMLRTFTVSSLSAQQRRYVMTHASAANMSAVVLRQDGAAKTESSVTAGVINLENDVCVIGQRADAAGLYFSGFMDMPPMFFNADLAAATNDQAALEGWMRIAHRTAA